MPRCIEIHDLNQPELDVYARLTENQLRNRLEPEKGVFIAQSTKVIRCALENGCVPVSILTEHKHLEGQVGEIISLCGDIPVYTANRALLEQLTGYKLTRGILCAMLRPKLPSLEELCANAHRIAVLDSIADSTNVGAIIRSAAALNIDGIVVTSTCCDPLNRRAVRVSMGTIFQIPWTEAPSAPEWKTQPWLIGLHALGFKTAAMALRNDTVSIDDPRLMAEDKLAIVLGTEGWGLPEKTIQACDYTIKIPMSHGVDSLNVAAASAVAFWQLARREN